MAQDTVDNTRDVNIQSDETLRTSSNNAASPKHKTGNLQEIRDILMGSQMRDYDARFRHLETRLATSVESLRNEVRERMDTIEVTLIQELKSTQQTLSQEKTERHEAMASLQKQWQISLSEEQKQRKQTLNDVQERIQQALNKEATQRQRSVDNVVETLQDNIQQHVHSHEQKLKQNESNLLHLEQHSLEVQQELRKKILDQYKTLSDDIGKRVGMLEQQLQQDIYEHERRKLDRTALSSLLMETALRLADEADVDSAISNDFKDA